MCSSDLGENKDEVIIRLKNVFESQGIKVFPISAVTGEGTKELFYYVRKQLDEIDLEPIVYDPEYVHDKDKKISEETYTVVKRGEGLFVVEGPKIERMLNNTNLESEKGFNFFQNFLKDNQILEELEKQGIIDGDTVRLYGWEFDYFK